MFLNQIQSCSIGSNDTGQKDSWGADLEGLVRKSLASMKGHSLAFYLYLPTRFQAGSGSSRRIVDALGGSHEDD